MTRKHFLALAHALRDAKPGEGADPLNTWLDCIHHVVCTLRTLNPAFDEQRFRRACGVDA